MAIDNTYNADYIDHQYHAWKSDPTKVSLEWQMFFQGFELGQISSASTGADTGEDPRRQSGVQSLVYRYRDIGHLLACLDPLSACPTSHPLLDLSAFGLEPADLKDTFFTRFGKLGRAPLQQIVQSLQETYCRSIGFEYMHIQDPEERLWLQQNIETDESRTVSTPTEKIQILRQLYNAALFETLLNKKYPGQTRFSLEGAEGLIPMLAALVVRSAANGCRDIVMGMAHRGRLNVLVNIFQKTYLEIFREFANSYDPDSIVGAGDVKYHNGYLSEVMLPENRTIRMLLVNNPSHLESVDPVVEGIARGLQDRVEGNATTAVLPILIHGDAAFSGQGVVAETLNLSQLEGYATGGTIHIVINNQIGYTTLPEHARSTRYSTDIAKMLMVPVFHIHGENPESLVRCMKLAYDYRERFRKDVVVDLVCYRRHGHNEGDEPYFTQPGMYERIRSRPSVHELYTRHLIDAGVISQDEIETIDRETNQCLTDQFEAEQKSVRRFNKPPFYPVWKPYKPDYTFKPVKTAVPRKSIQALSREINRVPETFSLHRKLVRIFQSRLDAVENGTGIDWGNAEHLAFASLLAEGTSIRLSGQDSQRGTFSHRHAVVFDSKTGSPFTPLNTIAPAGTRLDVYNSSLSETGVLGFDYGYSWVQPQTLVIWEAQFGDFVNNAQSMIDVYITVAQAKWQRLSGLTMLLPHGWEGLGPEHSSARLERFLQLCADENILVCYPTTPAQYFHLLRRQIKAAYRKPLIVMTPKGLLRLPAAVSSLDDLSEGSFQEVLVDEATAKCRRVVFCSGKIYYEFKQRMESNGTRDITLVRLEQLYPFPETALKKVIDAGRDAREWVWAQEEPENMGAYQFVRSRLEKLTGASLVYIGRKPASSPATGFHNIYQTEQADVINRTIGSAG
ncbi:2-oxoglutarate dehydrogenase E1 component [bacterium]|nr:2-oxoglutarate dehydrogenase E1 component [bacterium]